MNKFALVCLFIFGVGFAVEQATPGDLVVEHNDPSGCNCGKGKGGR